MKISKQWRQCVPNLNYIFIAWFLQFVILATWARWTPAHPAQELLCVSLDLYTVRVCTVNVVFDNGIAQLDTFEPVLARHNIKPGDYVDYRIWARIINESAALRPRVERNRPLK